MNAGGLDARDVTELWAGFDPRVTPLNFDAEQWHESGAAFQKGWFTSETWQGHPVRVFAMTGRPDADDPSVRFPGVLHIHGGGQTAALTWVRHWVARGFACVSFDICGEADGRTEVTDWGPLPARMLKDSIVWSVQPSVRHSPWYHYTIAARRALTLLESLPGVDGERLGLFGISYGGNVAWIVAGCDDRVRTAVPIYASGWNYWRPDEPPSPDLAAWTATLAPETYARYIDCPVLLLNATNDFNGSFERCFDSLSRVRGETRHSFSFGANHHLYDRQADTLDAWMRDKLADDRPWPATPVLELRQADGRVEAVVDEAVDVGPDRPVTDVEIAYTVTLDCAPQARFWRTTRDAVLSLPAGARSVLATANVTYEAGFTLTSWPCRLDGVQVASGVPATTLVDDFAAGVGDWTANAAPTDPIVKTDHVQAATMDDRPVLTFDRTVYGEGPLSFSFGTHKVGDPQYRAPSGAALACRFFAGPGTSLEVHAWADHWGPAQRRHVATCKWAADRTVEAPCWTNVVVEAAQCLDEHGTPLADFSTVNRIDFVGTAPPGTLPAFVSVRWSA